jgi:hypothetical protein
MKLVRISSGEEIIGDVTESDNSVIVKNGFVLIPGGEGKIAFMPFMPYTKNAKDGLKINKQFVLFIADPLDELVKQIQSQLKPKSSLITPNTDIIV